MKLLQEIIQILHLNKKWVRWMIGYSIIIYFLLIAYPNPKPEMLQLVRNDTLITIIARSMKPNWPHIIAYIIISINTLTLTFLNLRKLFLKKD
jgi:hypothetical protein